MSVPEAEQRPPHVFSCLQRKRKTEQSTRNWWDPSPPEFHKNLLTTWGSHKPLQCFAITLCKTLFFRRVLRAGLGKSQSRKARFQFQASTASVTGGADVHSHASIACQWVFKWLPQELEGVCMSQLDMSMDRGMQEKVTGSFPGDRPYVFPRCYKQQTMQLIFANI